MNSQLAMHLPPRIARWALPVVLALVAAAVTPAGAQDAAPYEAVIVGAAEVPVRANADEQFYPLAILTPGTIVTVTGERRGFLRVDLSTRAFTNTTYGIIKYPRNAAALVSPDTPGQRGRATGPVAVFGPNLGTDDPIGDGWKRVGDVASGAAIDVRDRTVVGDEVILRVA
ncbi:MAG: hypothetical protein KDA25_08610, partial [Phycisphaerales bacterium]|nr:hypothetical protein [Phycisphaerales bacterium]